MAADFKASILSNRAIGDKYGCSETWVRKKAQEFGWKKDLSLKIQAKAEEIVRINDACVEYENANDDQIVEANAKHIAAIQIEERKDVRLARNLVRNLFAECEDQTQHTELYQNIADVMRDQGDIDYKMKVIYDKVISFPGRVDSVKKLTEAFKTLVELERRVYNIDDVQNPGTLGSGVNVNISFN